jgi:hypothetical protein
LSSDKFAWYFAKSKSGAALARLRSLRIDFLDSPRNIGALKSLVLGIRLKLVQSDIDQILRAPGNAAVAVGLVDSPQVVWMAG